MATQPANSDIATSGISGNPETNHPATADKVAQPPVSVESQQLHRELTQLADTAPDANAFYSAVFNIASQQVDCLAMWHVRITAGDAEAAETNGPSIEARPISDDQADVLWEVIQEEVGPVIIAAQKSGDITSRLLPPTDKNSIVAAPVLPLSNDGGGAVTEFILGCYNVAGQSLLRQQWLTGMLAQTARQWQQKRVAMQIAVESRSLSDSLQLVQEISVAENPGLAAIVLVNRLRKLFGASQVGLSLNKQGSRGKVIAVSDVEQFDGNSAAGKLLSSAINQAITYQDNVVWPEHDPAQPSAHTLPLQQYGESISASSVAAIQLTDLHDQPTGALLISREGGALTDQQLGYMQKVGKLAFSQYESVARANRSVAEVLRDRLTPRSWSKTAKLAALVFSIAMLIPLPYRVKCDCSVQPTSRRFVAAPYHGVLEKSLVEAGEIVTAGQVVARMDGRQLRIELAGLKAEHKGARRKSDSSRAIGEVAQSQIAKMEMRRLAAQIELTKTRMQDLEVRSPIDGIIVSGDLEKAQGAPLETGQTLFEVAPLEKMVAEIGVPESEIQYINNDDTVTLKLNAFPFQSWTGKVERIHPGTEVIDDQTVFVTEVELDNEQGLLKPGMEGAAKISTHWTPLGWNLFHNTWENVRCWTVW